MRPVIRVCLTLLVFLLIPTIPFLILGESFELQVKEFIEREDEWSARIQAGLVIGILASDILLPIPASAVTTYAGGTMGFWQATAASWIGMTIGASIGFGLAKLLGRQFIRRLMEPDDLIRIERFAERLGGPTLWITRPLPILSEACVLLMGTTPLSWRRFLVPVLTANLLISAVYAAIGAGFKNQRDLVVVAIVSGTIPLLVALFVRRRLSPQEVPMSEKETPRHWAFLNPKRRTRSKPPGGGS